MEKDRLTEKGEKRKKSPNRSIAALCGSTLVLVALCISVATPAWVVSADVQVGLWHLCYNGTCSQLNDVMTYLQTVRGFDMSSITLASTVFLVSCLGSFQVVSKKLVTVAAAILLLCSALTSLVSGSVFTVYYPMKDDLAYGYSFILLWIGCVLAFVFGISFAAAAKN